MHCGNIFKTADSTQEKGPSSRVRSVDIRYLAKHSVNKDLAGQNTLFQAPFFSGRETASLQGGLRNRGVQMCVEVGVNAQTLDFLMFTFVRTTTKNKTPYVGLFTLC